MKFILGKKIQMTQMFDNAGKIVPLTLIEAGPCLVTQVKTQEKDGYQAVQVGFIKKVKNLKKSEKGREFKYLKEFRAQTELKPGDEINASSFQPGEMVKVSGFAKGKGFAGAVKRHGFKGKLSATHGTKHEHRTIGSIGSRFPQRVVKGRRMPGRMGGQRVTVKNLEIAKIDGNIIAVKGAVPGRRGTLLEISI